MITVVKQYIYKGVTINFSEKLIKFVTRLFSSLKSFLLNSHQNVNHWFKL